MVKDAKNVIVGLDIGTSKIVAIVADRARMALNIIGPARSLRADSRRRRRQHRGDDGVDPARAGRGRADGECRITEVYTGIAGSHIRSLNSSGMVAIKEKEVTQADIDRVVETAKPSRYRTTSRSCTSCRRNSSSTAGGRARAAGNERRAPRGQGAHRHRGGVGGREHHQVRRRCGVVKDVILQPLASSIAVLNDDEKELGICLMDIGGGTTDLAVFAGGAIRHTAVIPIAGDQVTNDIAMTLPRQRRS
jgi:cell division protein FtsA